jgi:ElaB/YqjD/DUF883 family membrane-anchored ribosome-binding protein
MTDSTTTANDQSTVDDLRNLIREAEQALGAAGGYATDEVQALRERLRDVLADGQSKLRNLSEAVRRQAGRADEVIRANPYQSIGAAAGLGLIAGFLISRSCSSDR